MASGGPVQPAPDGLDPLLSRPESHPRRAMLDAPDAAQLLQYPLERLAVGEAEVALRVAAELHPGGDAHVRALQDLEREHERGAREAPGVGQHVERPGGWGAHPEPDPAQAVAHDPPPLAEHPPGAGALLPRLAQAVQGRPLDELV